MTGKAVPNYKALDDQEVNEEKVVLTSTQLE